VHAQNEYNCTSQSILQLASLRPAANADFFTGLFYQHFRYFNSKIKFLVKIGRGKLGQLRKRLITYKYIARGLVTERILSLIFFKCLLLCKKKNKLKTKGKDPHMSNFDRTRLSGRL
jgi:hypothetical protein